MEQTITIFVYVEVNPPYPEFSVERTVVPVTIFPDTTPVVFATTIINEALADKVYEEYNRDQNLTVEEMRSIITWKITIFDSFGLRHITGEGEKCEYDGHSLYDMISFAIKENKVPLIILEM